MTELTPSTTDRTSSPTLSTTRSASLEYLSARSLTVFGSVGSVLSDPPVASVGVALLGDSGDGAGAGNANNAPDERKTIPLGRARIRTPCTSV